MTSPGTYLSTNARPCPDCGLRRCPSGCNSLGLVSHGWTVPVVPGPVTGEIADPSGGVVTVPVVTLPAHPADYVTMTGLLNAISEGPQSHDGARKGGGRAPVWALVCLFAGLVLVGFSMVAGAWLSMQ